MPGGLAEFERELIRARTSEGRARAKARGQSFGRPHKLTVYQRRKVLKRKVPEPSETVLAGGDELAEVIDVQRLRPLGRAAVRATDAAQDVTDSRMARIERLASNAAGSRDSRDFAAQRGLGVTLAEVGHVLTDE